MLTFNKSWEVLVSFIIVSIVSPKRNYSHETTTVAEGSVFLLKTNLKKVRPTLLSNTVQIDTQCQCRHSSVGISSAKQLPHQIWYYVCIAHIGQYPLKTALM